MSEKPFALLKTDLQLCLSGLDLQIASFKRAANSATRKELRDIYSKYHDDAIAVRSKVQDLEASL